MDFEIANSLSPTEFSADNAFCIWKNFAKTNGIRFALYRDEDFWNWRYKQSVGFDYLCFADGDSLLVGRFDEITDADNDKLNGKKVFRIIELLALSESWNRFLQASLLWVKEQGAILADFQISSQSFDKLLFSTGFRKADTQNPVTKIPAIFTPIRHDVPPINLVIKLSDNPDIDFDDTYFVKSDGDMDRPID